MSEKRKICFVITSRTHYARSKLLLAELRDHPGIDLQIVLGGSAILDMYGNVEPLLLDEGYTIHGKILMSLGGGTPTAMAKTTGLGLFELPTLFEQLAPDVVVVRADRFETLAIAAAAAYMNIPVAHIEGGDVSGTIDESVRHAVTKLSHIHFATNEDSRNRIVRMGENPDYVFNVGSPEIEFVARNSYEANADLINYLGVGDTIDLEKPFIMVMQHPVTTEFVDARKQIDETLHAVDALDIPAIWFWPNIDAGTDLVSKGIRSFRETHKPARIRFIKHLPPEQFIGLLKKAHALVGNSSAGIKEAAFLGVPVVNIGSRQAGRYRPINVTDVPYERNAIRAAVLKQVATRRYPKDEYHYKGEASKKIADILSSIRLYHQKKFHE